MAFIKRLWIYFHTMFPLPIAAIAATTGFFSFFFLMVLVHGNQKLFYPGVWFAVVSLFLYSILFRLHDELKDADFDRQFNPLRPLVTGVVKYSDIKILIIILFFVVAILNFDRGLVTSAFLLLIVFLTLSTRWFMFPEQVQKNFALLTITHQPILPLVYFYIYTVYLSETGQVADYGLVLPLFFLFSLPNVGWEIARKTRAPSDENGFPTYSAKWGVRKATVIPMFYILVSTLGLLAIGMVFKFSPYFVLANLALGVGVMLVFLRFLLRPESGRNYLKPAIEFFDLGFRIIIIGEAMARVA